MKRTHAFTLIELLVVVAIIAVLLALLVPAMEKAIYQAELAVCETRLKGTGSSAHQFAFDHRRYYPRHIANEPNTGAPMFCIAAEESVVAARNHDMRPNIEGYIGLKLLVDPLAGRQDLSEKPDTYNEYIWLPYALWFGWGYLDTNTGIASKGMKKIGDRVTYDPQGISVNILASDLDLIDQNGGGQVTSAHPDRDGVTKLVNYQDATTRGAGAGDDANLASSNIRVTYSWWETFLTPARGLSDLNFLYGDGAVVRYGDVRFDEDGEGDRMVGMPWSPNSPTDSVPLRRVHLPRQ